MLGAEHPYLVVGPIGPVVDSGLAIRYDVHRRGSQQPRHQSGVAGEIATPLALFVEHVARLMRLSVTSSYLKRKHLRTRSMKKPAWKLLFRQHPRGPLDC